MIKTVINSNPRYMWRLIRFTSISFTTMDCENAITDGIEYEVTEFPIPDNWRFYD